MSELFYTGLSGLAVARSALMTTAHNTANVYTAGYSRQSSIVVTNGAIMTGSGFIGTGASVTTVHAQLRPLPHRAAQRRRVHLFGAVPATTRRSTASTRCWPTRPPA